MKVYLVGGAVRDALLAVQRGGAVPRTNRATLDRPVDRPTDRDWVVVGATPEQMLALGFVPVGRDFPVFLHPESKEEYALARTERKTARGYHGFAFDAAPDVSLEQDLARRDLSINAMALPAGECQAGQLPDAASVEALLAQNPKQWLDQVIDPFGGQADLAQGVLRHVGPAFAEDPVRILRVARFAARFSARFSVRSAPEDHGFVVADSTLRLMQEMVAAGEVQALVSERVWQEIGRGLMENQPSRMWAVLREAGALAVIFPELDRLWGVPQRAEHHPEVDTGVHTMLVVNMAARLGAPLSVRWACLVHDLGKGTTPQHILPRHLGHETRSADLARAVAERWRVNAECKELADVVAKEHGHIHRSQELGAEALLRLLTRLDAFRRPQRLPLILLACECDARGRAGHAERPYPQKEQLMQALRVAMAVDTAAIAHSAKGQTGQEGKAIAEAIAQARVQALQKAGSEQTAQARQQ